jgi:hypothetical protein
MFLFLNDDPKENARGLLIQSAKYTGDFISLTDRGVSFSEKRDTVYYEKRLKQYVEELELYRKMPLNEIEQLAEEEYQKELSIYKEKTDYAHAQLQYLEKVKKEVNAWTPPSKEHEGVKNVALDKLETDITVERTILRTLPPLPVEPEEYLRRLLTGIEATIEFYKERIKNVKTQNTQTSDWLKTFMKSLDKTYGKKEE